MSDEKTDQQHRSMPRLRKFLRVVEDHERVLNILNTTMTALFTVVLGTSTVFLWKETRDLRNFAEDQSTQMKASIAEAARSASAMQQVATAMAAEANLAQQSVAQNRDPNVRSLRAYLTLGLGAVIPQDATTNYHFEIRMNLENVGSTPAYNVRSVARAAVLPFPLPADFQLPILDEKLPTNVVGPHQTFVLTGIADQIYSDQDVDEAKQGIDKHLYVYGAIDYQDAFGETRHTNFCHAIVWLKNDQFMSVNQAYHTNAD